MRLVSAGRQAGVKNSVFREIVHRMTALRHEDRALETHEYRAVGLTADRANSHDPLRRPPGGFTLRQHLGLGVDRVADEHRGRELDVGPAEIADRLLAD